MTDSNQIVRQVEELLGSEGCELAEQMVIVLKSRGYITFDAQDGYELSLPDWNDGGQRWNELLADAGEMESKSLFHAHLDKCSQCREHPHNLCAEGGLLL